MVTVDEGRVLELTWVEEDGDSLLRFEIVPRDAGCLLVLDHSRLPADSRPGYGAGWQSHLEALDALLAGRDAVRLVGAVQRTPARVRRALRRGTLSAAGLPCRGGPRRAPHRADRARLSPPTARGQVWEWTARGAAGYEEMTNLPARLRGELDDEVPFSTLRLETEARSRDGTVKALFRTARRPPGRGGAHALPRRPALDLRLVAVGLPAHLHVLRDGPDALRPQPDRVGDPRPGAPLPAARARSTTASSWAWASRC